MDTRGTADERLTSPIKDYKDRPDGQDLGRPYFFRTSITKLIIEITSDSNSKSVISASFSNDAEGSGSNAS